MLALHLPQAKLRQNNHREALHQVAADGLGGGLRGGDDGSEGEEGE